MIAAAETLEAIALVARRLGSLADEVVFLGGAVAGLLVTDRGASPPRPTKDVDVVIEVASTVDYSVRLREELRALGFTEDTEENAPLCRWVIDGVKVDVMPTDPRVLGLSNRWFAAALANATRFALPGGPTIRLVTAPIFLATKLEAFHDRGRGDYQGSHDLEDFIAVVDGRGVIEDEVTAAADDLRTFLADAIANLLRAPAFLDALPGHLPGDPASQSRLPWSSATTSLTLFLPGHR